MPSAVAAQVSALLRNEQLTLGQTGHQIRIFGTREKPVFAAADLGKALNLDIHSTTRDYPDLAKGKLKVPTPGGMQEISVLTEFGIYKLFMNTHRNDLMPFQEWVCDVLRTIRLEGRYELPGASQKLLQDAETARLAAEQARQAAQEEVAQVRDELARALKAKEKAKEKADELRRQIENKKRKGQCIYLLQNSADAERKLYKIGFSKDLNKREENYSTSLPDGVDVLHCVYTRDASLAEKIVHHILDEFRYEREWFQGDPQLFSQIITAVTNFLDGMVESLDNVVPFKTAERIAKMLRKAKAFTPGEDDGAESDGSNASVIINGPVSGNVTVHVNNSPTISLEDLLRRSKRIFHEHGCSTRLDHLRQAFTQEFGWGIKQLTPRKAFAEFNPAFIVHPDIRACHVCDSVEGAGCCPGYNKKLGKKVGLVRNMRLRTAAQE